MHNKEPETPSTGSDIFSNPPPYQTNPPLLHATDLSSPRFDFVGKLELSAGSVSSRADIRLITKYDDLLDQLKRELHDPNYIRETRKKDWAWRSRCRVGKHVVEDLVLTKMTHPWGGKDHRDYESYFMLVDRYKQQSHPRLRLTPLDMDDPVHSQACKDAEELILISLTTSL